MLQSTLTWSGAISGERSLHRGRPTSVLSRLALLLLCGCPAYAHDPITTKLTWTREISRIVHKHCASCHREGGRAMSLLTYEEARPWAKAIKEEVLERRMPPWGAVKGFGDFKNDISLSQEQMDLIANWVEGGAPEGDTKYLPPAPVFSPEPNAALKGGNIVDGKLVLKTATRLSAIRPLAAVSTAQVIATRPDGSIEPLLWLRNYKVEWHRTFVYREPVLLPAGTTITVSPPARVALVSR
jgi:hypothetical protein